MVASTLSPPTRGGLMSSMTELKRDRFVFVGWSGLLLFPTAYLAIGETDLLARRLLQAGIPTGWRLLTLRVLISSRQLCQLLLTLWVILFFYFGVLSLRGFHQVVPTWGTLGFCGAPQGPFALIGFMLRQFELARLIGIRPYNAIAFSGPIAVFVSVFLIYPLGQSSWLFCSILRCCSNLPLPTLPPRISQLDPESLPHDGSSRYPGWGVAFCDPWCYSREYFVSGW